MGEYVTDADSLVLHLRSSTELGAEAARIFKDTEDGKHIILIPSVIYAELIAHRKELPGELVKVIQGIKRGRYRVVQFDETMAELLLDMELDSVPNLMQQIAVATAKQENLELITGNVEIINCRQISTIWNSNKEKLMEVRIFISYARQDSETVEKLYDKLRSETSIPQVQLKPWLDKKDILPGSSWKHSIKKAIRESQFFLVCLSNNSVKRRGVLREEITEALEIRRTMLEDDKFLIPVRFEECEVPESLGDIQWVDLFESGGWDMLRRAIEQDIKERLMT